MMGTLILRAIIAAVSWIGTGRTVWILPNALADDKPLSELFTPLIDVQEANIRSRDKYGWFKHILLRVGVGALLAGITYILYTKSPGSDKVRQNAFKYRDEIFDYLNVHNDRKLLTNKDGGGASGKGAAGAGAAGGNPRRKDGRTVHIPSPPQPADENSGDVGGEEGEKGEDEKIEL